ncbi:MAG TPA: nucleotidyltransferase domain-containing protein [Longimicrobiales bacterium]|nr:nucleotidyltransferase domain-containing protein [Longimicrobiales bacterium]
MLNTNPRDSAQRLTAGLRERAGTNLRSVVLHGSVAREEAIAGVSDVNVLVLLDEARPDQLRALAPLAREWLESAGGPPLILTEREWKRAADVFAIEVADMKEAHELLFGTDPVAALEPKRHELRLQTERELRGKLLQLREGTLLAAESPAELGWLLSAALPSFTAYMRATLRLAGRDVPRDTPSVILATAEVIVADPAPFAAVWEARWAGRKLEAKIDDPIVADYYGLAERMADHVDTLP